MKTTTSYSFHAFFLVLSLFLVTPVLAQQPQQAGGRDVVTAQWRGEQIQYVEGKIAIKLNEGANRAAALRAVQPVVARTLQDFDELGWGFFELPKGEGVLSAVSALEQRPSVSIAYPITVGTIGTEPDDSERTRQWSLNNTGQPPANGTNDADIDAYEAWNLTTGSSDVVIAILDTGLPMQNGSLSHPDLDDAGKIILGPDYINDGSGLRDNHGHGTHVAGIAAAETNNNAGVAGVCWGCKVLVIQTNNGTNGVYTTQSFYNGVKYASDCKTNNPGTEVVINFSSGDLNDSPLYHDAIEYAGNRDVLIVSIAHNDDGGPVRFPAALSTDYNNMIAVSATDHNDDFADYSNSGPEVNVAAPGGFGEQDGRSIYSTLPNYSTTSYGSNINYGYSDGTSMAAPHVAGTAALMLSIEPFLRPYELRDILEETASDRGPSGFDNAFGYGRINAFNAVTEAAKPDAPNNLVVTNAGNVHQNPDLDWSDNSEPDLDHYNVYRCAGYHSSCNWTLIGTTTGSSYTDYGVMIARRSNAQDLYGYHVRAVDSGSFTSAQSNAATTWGDTPMGPALQNVAEGPLPEAFALAGNAPNPFRQQTEIRYALPEAAEVELIVYDVMGREVARPVDGPNPAGFHEARFEAEGLPSGVYFYHLSAGDAFTKSGRMVLVK